MSPTTDSSSNDVASSTGSDTVVQNAFADRYTLLGGIGVLVVVLVSIFAPYIAPTDPQATFELMTPPNGYSEGDFTNDGTIDRVWHPLGTDSQGRDILTELVYGARISLLVAFATVGFAFVVGTAIGLLAGYYRGWIDSLLMRYVDFQWAFPELVLAIAIIAIAGGIGVVPVIIAVGFAFIDDFARIVRSEVLKIREEAYVTAARAVGMSPRRIMIREILPNVTGTITVQTTLLVPIAILWEAGLSFIGVGVAPTTPTWGLLLSDGRQFINEAWWISVLPGLAILVTVLSFTLLGEGLREAFDVSDREVKDR
ncbi:ABC transporter permease [Natrarchaeobius sp. A-rgal3]|uniref:ABC transporter permease n=1 Tax=Natrarchaeobius versutus TaxID=1679078 RepID=UPI00350EA6D4